MINKILNDSGIEFLLNNKKYLKIFDIGFSFVSHQFTKHKYSVDMQDFNVSFFNMPEITSLKLNDVEYDSYFISLTGFDIEISENIFKYNFSDNESLFSVHRFRWLLIGIEDFQNKEFAKKSISILNYWIDNFNTVGRIVNETYSICERLLNILYFISIVKENDIKIYEMINIEKLEKIYKLQIVDILSNIEYHGKYTNNHILNNARALYILGQVFSIDFVSITGYKLLENQYDVHIKEGVLQEGSFHYQVLITRTILEIYNISIQMEDKVMQLFLKNRLNMILSITQSLHSEFSSLYPLVGDVSPDFPVEFFHGFPFSKKNDSSKWNNIFNIKITDFECLESKYKFWKKFIFDKIEIWIIDKKFAALDHSHNDNGSFIIFYKGKPIIYDIGRFNYDRKNIYNFMLGQSSHNGIVHNIDFPRTSVFYKYFNKISDVKITENENIVNVMIEDVFLQKKYCYNLIINSNFVSIDTQEDLNLFCNPTSICDEMINFDDFKININHHNLTFSSCIMSLNYGKLNDIVKIEAINND